jgi:hypothetical protein
MCRSMRVHAWKSDPGGEVAQAAGGGVAVHSPADEFTHTLMIRRSVSDPNEVAYLLVHAPHIASTNAMVAVAGIRWALCRQDHPA